MDALTIREQVLSLIRAERDRQLDMYGDNADLPLGLDEWLMPYTDESPAEIEDSFRGHYEYVEKKDGHVSWGLLIREEVAEMFAAISTEDLLEEAIQVAALCVSLVETHLTRGHVVLSADNMRMIREAWQPADVRLRRSVGGYFQVAMGPSGLEQVVMEGIEIEGTLHSICLSGPGTVTVLTGDELITHQDGPDFPSVHEAKAYIESLRQ